MKAIRKGDGKEVDVILLHDKEYIDVLPNEHDCKLIYPAETLFVDEVVDWQAFRREAAKEILCALVGNKDYLKVIGRIEPETMLAIRFADELIKQLKKGEEE